MKITRILISISTFSVALFVGFKSGTQINLIDALIQFSLNTSSTFNLPATNQDQLSLVIIGIDETSEAQLESIWLAAYSEITQNITFVPIFPSPTNPEQNQFLAEAFYLDQGKPSNIFWQTLQSTHNLQWDGYILGNRIDTIEMINLLDGIYINETLMSGEQIVNNISSWKDNPQLAAEKQQILLAGICNRLEDSNTLASKSTWEMVYKNPFDSDLQTVLQIANWSSKFHRNGQFSCEFPVSGGTQTMLIAH